MSDLNDVQPTRCPLCGNDNACGIAAGHATCWCFDVKISPDALARVPDAARDKACVCQACGQDVNRGSIDHPSSINRN